MGRFLALFALSVYAFASPSQVCAAQPSADFGGLYLTTLPSGADVWVDGAYVGRTPIVLDGLASGKHAVTLTKAGWNVAEIVQQIIGRTVKPSSTVLQRNARAHGESGRIALHGLQSGSQVSLDGLQNQLGAFFDSSSGIHQVVVRQGKVKMVRNVTVYPDTTTDLLIPSATRDTVSVPTRSVVVAPAEQYLPDSAFRVEHGKVLIDYDGHSVVAHIGQSQLKYDHATVAFDAPPAFVRGKLYLPLELLLELTGHSQIKTK